MNNPLDNDWLSFVFDETIFKFGRINNICNSFKISHNVLKESIILWMKGEWYESISELFDGDIDKALKVVNSAIIYDVQTVLGQVIKLVETDYLDSDFEVSPQVIKFPQYVMYGTTRGTVLDLIEIGFNERISNNKLGEIIDENFNYKSIKDLKKLLLEQENFILNSIKNEVPVLSYEALKSNYEYLKFY